MDAKETGGPAFPADYLATDPAMQGMTLKDYFMAHAPAIPQDWFIPIMPPCPAVPSIRAIGDDLFKHEIICQWELSAEHQSDAVRQWFDKREKAEIDQSEWQAEFRKQLCIQWPAAWAMAMLEQRKC